MSEWKPGFVRTVQGEVRIEKGQRWGYFPCNSASPNEETMLALTVVSTSPEGEVVLRPDPVVAEHLFPLHEVEFRGKPVMMRTCPFQWVEASTRVSTSGFHMQIGDLLAHEAWDVWKDMAPSHLI